ncbi:MAG: ABC transporter permease [Candidatus Nealsonbacteria bacterium]|nr:ABC transporter permease [Candidatus Nealsonbacteria bacterium]
MFFWITVELFGWGFITLWLKSIAGADKKIDFILLLLSALIFWHIFMRVQNAFSVSFLEDIWARNMINLFASPLRFSEFVVALVFYSLVSAGFGLLYVSALAFVLYALDIWQLGFYIIPLFLNILLFGWSLGLLTVSLIIRYGPSIEVLAWALPYLFFPISAVYYPLSVFPELLQKIAFFVPTMHLFEGMRRVLLEGVFPKESVAWASVLNLFYFSISALVFYLSIKVAIKKGLIARLVTD